MPWIIVLLVLEIPVAIALVDWSRRSPEAFLGGAAGKAKWRRRLLLGLATGWLGVGNAVVIWYVMMVVRAKTDGEPLEAVACETVFIQATPEQCMAVITDIESYIQWSPGITDATVLARDRDGRPTEAAFVRDAPMGGGTFSYTMSFAYSEPHGVRLTMLSAETEDPERMEMLNQMMGSMATTYRFEPNGAETVMEFELRMSLPPQIPAMIASRMPAMMASKTTTELKERIEHLIKVG